MNKPTSFLNSNTALWATVILLLVIGIGLIAHRYWVYEVPLWYGKTQTVWMVEAKVEFDANEGPIKVSLARPADQSGFTVLNETGASPGYGLNFSQGEGANPRAEWAVRAASGHQELFYRAEVLVSNPLKYSQTLPAPALKNTTWPEPYASAINQVLTRSYSTSADNFTFTQELLKHFQKGQMTQDAELLRTYFKQNFPEQFVALLHRAQVPAAIVYGLELRDGRRRQGLEPLLRVWQGEESRVFSFPKENETPIMDSYPDAPILLWEQSGSPVLDVVGGKNSSVRFSMIQRQETTYGQVAEHLSSQYDFLNFSIHGLPIEEQAMFKTLLILPIGALVVCILRVLVGLKTSGTFMPVLIALAFIETSLWVGVIGFLVVVSTGLVIRSYLSRLNLLLVPRITAVIIMVVGIIAAFSVLSYKVGLTEGLKITFFPLIILSWTIERMSILWEEEGSREVWLQGGGSLLTAILAYFAMTNPWVRHLTFNFVGIQFVVLALVILIGSYTGYRLLELKRFKVFG